MKKHFLTAVIVSMAGQLAHATPTSQTTEADRAGSEPAGLDSSPPVRVALGGGPETNLGDSTVVILDGRTGMGVVLSDHMAELDGAANVDPLMGIELSVSPAPLPDFADACEALDEYAEVEHYIAYMLSEIHAALNGLEACVQQATETAAAIESLIEPLPEDGCPQITRAGALPLGGPVPNGSYGERCEEGSCWHALQTLLPAIFWSLLAHPPDCSGLLQALDALAIEAASEEVQSSDCERLRVSNNLRRHTRRIAELANTATAIVAAAEQAASLCDQQSLALECNDCDLLPEPDPSLSRTFMYAQAAATLRDDLFETLSSAAAGPGAEGQVASLIAYLADVPDEAVTHVVLVVDPPDPELALDGMRLADTVVAIAPDGVEPQIYAISFVLDESYPPAELWDVLLWHDMIQGIAATLAPNQ